MEEVKLPIPDDNGYLFHIPPREPWKKVCEELEFEKHYIPEEELDFRSLS